MGFSLRWLLLLRSTGSRACRLQQAPCMGSIIAALCSVTLRPVGFSQIRDWTHVSCTGRQILYHWATKEALVGSFKTKWNALERVKPKTLKITTTEVKLQVRYLKKTIYDSALDLLHGYLSLQCSSGEIKSRNCGWCFECFIKSSVSSNKPTHPQRKSHSPLSPKELDFSKSRMNVRVNILK